jgi:hypothetical protein
MAILLRSEVIRKVELARSFFDLAQVYAKSSHDLNLFIAINQLQDAVEIFLFALADHLGISFKEKSSFDGYLESISSHTGANLPFRQRIIALNKARVNSKHYAIQPDRREVNGFISVAREFFVDRSLVHFGLSFDEISLVDLLSSGAIKTHLSNALLALKEKKYGDALIESRKAFYIEFEKNYDISIFKDSLTGAEQAKITNLFHGLRCKAPYYARNAEYILKNVSDPTGFIVLDHSKVDADLSSAGISHTQFWNVWRMTPQLFHLKEEDKWFVKGEFRVMEESGIQERAEYAVHSTIELCLTAQRNRDATRQGAYGAWGVKLRPGEIKIYAKSDLNSESQIIPTEFKDASSSCWVNGIDGNVYWECSLDDYRLRGFILQDDLILD